MKSVGAGFTMFVLLEITLPAVSTLVPSAPDHTSLFFKRVTLHCLIIVAT